MFKFKKKLYTQKRVYQVIYLKYSKYFGLNYHHDVPFSTNHGLNFLCASWLYKGYFVKLFLTVKMMNDDQITIKLHDLKLILK